MSKGQQKKSSQNIKLCREELIAAREGDDSRQISMTAASLGLALSQAYKSAEGLKYLNEAIQIAKKVDDLGLHVHCLGMKALAFQFIGRFPDAFKVAEEILKLGEKHEDDALRFDAFASMGQILMESGEEILALEKFKEAQEISDTIDDPRRTMNIRSAMGNYSLNVAAPDQAFDYFEDALAIAVSLGDKNTEIGLLGNLGTILSWKEQHREAVQAFEAVLDHVRKEGNKEVEAQTLRHLANSHNQLKQPNKVLEYAKAGLALDEWIDTQITVFFYEKIIATHYKLGENEEAEAYTLQAIEFAASRGDEGKELDFLLSLGESFVLSGKPEEALDIYKKAVQKANNADRKKDAAYLTGRVGITLAELGQLSEAVTYHETAVKLAQERNLADLEGEQLLMLAIAYFEKNDNKKAQEYCQAAIQVYVKTGLKEDEQKARQLLAKIDA